MAEKLVIVSDMWGVKKGLWITSYLGYLQHYFDITFYDSQQIAAIEPIDDTEKTLNEAFVNGGIATASNHLLEREKTPCHYLAFSTGGTIVWNAAMKGLPIKSFYCISATRIRMETACPSVPFKLLFGKNDAFKPDENWLQKTGTELEAIPNYGHTLYTEDKIIKKVSMEMLKKVTSLQQQKRKVV